MIDLLGYKTCSVLVRLWMKYMKMCYVRLIYSFSVADNRMASLKTVMNLSIKCGEFLA